VGFVPSSGQIGSACGLILLGAVISGAIGLLGGSESSRSRPDPQAPHGAVPTS
jgi:hypothetical protein